MTDGTIAYPDIDRKLLALPSGFARVFLGLKPYEWQDKVMDAVALGDKPVSLAAANESGKTSVVAVALVLWHASVFANSRVVTTAGVYRQVREQLWPALQRYQHLFPGWDFSQTRLRAANGATAVGFSTDDSGRFEGFHGSEDEPLLIIVDEAKSVDKGIYEAIQRCRPQRLLIMSSTGDAVGDFYESQTKKRSKYNAFKVTADECPHISQESIQRTIDMYGEQHALTRSMLYSEFIEDSNRMVVIPRKALMESLDNQTPFKKGETIAFIDFGAGGDETVIAIARGNRIDELICWVDANTMSTVGRCLTELKRNKVEAKYCYGDEGGIGKPMIDAMREAGYNINRVNNGTAADEPENYKNFGVEMWYKTKRAIENKRVILPKDPLMIEQLVERLVVYDSKGKLGMESKEMLKSRGIDSPDRADAVCGVITAMQRHELYVKLAGGGVNWDDFSNPTEKEQQYKGFYTG